MRIGYWLPLMANTTWKSCTTWGKPSPVRRKTPFRNDGDSIGQAMAKPSSFATSSPKLPSGLIVSKKSGILRSSMILYMPRFRGLEYVFYYRYVVHLDFRLHSFIRLRPDQVAVSDINRFAFIVEGAENIAHSISRYATFEQIYLKYEDRPTRAVKGLEKALIKLYAVILTYLGKAKKYFDEPTLSKPYPYFRSHIVAKQYYRAHGQSWGNS